MKKEEKKEEYEVQYCGGGLPTQMEIIYQGYRYYARYRHNVYSIERWDDASKNYLEVKEKEIAEYNIEHKVDTSELINRRILTNIGTFRAYISAYLKNHPKVKQDMTFLIRQLPPGPTGLPIEIYVFANDTVWANYEAIQSDIFDHILAVVPEFGLKVFQYPTGFDFRKIDI